MKRVITAMIGFAALGLGLGAGAHAALDADHQGKPHLLRSIEGGLWEITQPGSRIAPRRMCLSDVSLLAQYEHRGQQCTRVTVSESGNKALMRYTCAGDGFGTSEFQVVTPRSLRLQTQGIKDGLPFSHTLHARRVGRC